jgi:chromosome partitioning protein
MRIISFLQFKGGVGKTTLAVNLADELSHRKITTTLIDADPQGNATQWAGPQKLLFPVRYLLLTRRNSLAWVRDVLKSRSEYVIIDTPAGITPTFDVAALIADVLVVPCGPSSLDIDSAAKTVKKARALRRDDDHANQPKILLAPNRVDPTTEEGAQITEALEEFGEKVAPPVNYDIEYVRAFASGTSVVSIEKGSRTAKDIAKLASFVMGL